MTREKRREREEEARWNGFMNTRGLEPRKLLPYLTMRNMIVQLQYNRDDDIEYDICQHSSHLHSELELYNDAHEH